MLARIGSLLLTIILVIGLVAGDPFNPLSAESPRHYATPLTGSLPASGALTLASPNAQSDATAVCDGGGYVQFTPDGRRPFNDVTACLDYAAQHGGAQGLIRRGSILLSDYGRAGSLFTRFTVTGLVPNRQYVATLRVQGHPTDPASLLFTADAQGNYAGKLSTRTSPDCTGGTKLFVEVTTSAGYLLGTNGTFLPC